MGRKQEVSDARSSYKRRRGYKKDCTLMTAKKLSVDDAVIQMDFSQNWVT